MTGKSRNSEQVNVVVRCRPMTQSEKARTKKVVNCNSKTKELSVTTGNTSSGLGQTHQVKTYNFDKVFGEKSTQLNIYDAVVSGQLDDVLSGYNCTVLAYGQTGTGKTYTMEGEQSEGSRWDEDPKSGIIPRALSHLFDRLNQMDCEFGVRISLLEIYNEEIYDLLSTSSDLPKLRIFDDASRKGSVVVSGLTEVHIRDKAQVYEILQQGSQKRRTAATNMNEFSSRSHSVFSVTVHTKDTTQHNMESEELVKIGKLNLVDLAGSENIGRSGAVDKRAREAGNINTSLLTLGRCITALVDKAPHIPYRESKLTRLLQDSLGGATKTSIIATISPGQNNLEETLSTLDYAFRSKSIHNRPKINQKLTKKALIQEYDREINRLRREVEAAREKNGVYLPHAQYQEMQQSLEANEAVLRHRFEELENYKELFQLKESELEMTKAELTATFDELKSNQEKLDEVCMERRKLAKYGNELYGQAIQLNETVNVATNDITKIHQKVDRVQQVNEENIHQFYSVLDDVKTDMKELQIQSNVQVDEIDEDVNNIITNNTDVLGKLNEKTKEEMKILLERLNEICGDVGNNMKITVSLNEKRETNSMNIDNKIQQIQKSVDGMNMSENINTNINKFVGQIENVMKNSQQSSQSSHNMMSTLGDSCFNYQHGVSDMMENNRNCFDQISTNQQKHREADDVLKKQVEHDDVIMYEQLQREFDEERSNIEEMLTSQQAHMTSQYEIMMKEMKETHDKVKEKLMKQQQNITNMRMTSQKLMTSRHDVYDDNVNKLYEDCDVTVNKLMTSSYKLDDVTQVECENIKSTIDRHQQLIDEQQHNINGELEDITSSSSKLKLNVEEKEEKAKNEIICHITQLQQDCNDYKEYVTIEENNIVHKYQEIQKKIDDECITMSKIDENNTNIKEEINKQTKQLQHVDTNINKMKNMMIKKNEEICENIQQIHRRKLVRPIPTGETPARNTTYKSIEHVSELPQFALDDLDETCQLSQHEHDQQQQQELSIDDVTDDDEENDDVIDGCNGILDESVTIPDKGGIPFFKTKGKGSKLPRAKQQKGTTPLRTLQTNHHNQTFDE